MFIGAIYRGKEHDLYCTEKGVLSLVFQFIVLFENLHNILC